MFYQVARSLGVVLPSVTLTLGVVLPSVKLTLRVVLPCVTLALGFVVPIITLTLEVVLPSVTLKRGVVHSSAILTARVNFMLVKNFETSIFHQPSTEVCRTSKAYATRAMKRHRNSCCVCHT